MNEIQILVWILAIIVMASGIGVLFVVGSAWYNVRRSPRMVMSYCDVHGPLTEKQVITFNDQPYCGRCWFGKVADAQRNHS